MSSGIADISVVLSVMTFILTCSGSLYTSRCLLLPKLQRVLKNIGDTLNVENGFAWTNDTERRECERWYEQYAFLVSFNYIIHH